jgi:hypothetical protein
MDRRALQQDMREAIADSRLLREQTATAIAQARALCESTLKTFERQSRGRPHLRLVEDDSSAPDRR